MKKNLVFLLLFFALFQRSNGQDTIGVGQYLLRNKTQTFAIQQYELYDGYLSPLYYTGFGLQYEQDIRRIWSCSHPNLSMQNRFVLNLASTLNPTKTAGMLYLNFEYSWGMYYHLPVAKTLTFLFGGTVSPEIGGRLLSRNVNNPSNLDFGATVNLAAQMQWKIKTKKRALTLNVSLISPFFGVLFSPRKGASYYEIFALGATDQIVHFTFFHNKYGFFRNYSLDIPFKNSILRLGVYRNLLKYSINDTFYKRKATGIVVGWQKNIFSFAGRKNVPPQNFIQF